MSARKQAAKAAPALEIGPLHLSCGSLTRLREEASQEIEKLIALLDALEDTDTDVEHDGSEPDEDGEPSLGSTENHPNPYRSINQGDQTTWSAGTPVGFGDVDCEGDEHDGAEPDEDGEPSLGSFDRVTDQRKSWKVTDRAAWAVTDAEVDDCENGGAQ